MSKSRLATPLALILILVGCPAAEPGIGTFVDAVVDTMTDSEPVTCEALTKFCLNNDLFLCQLDGRSVSLVATCSSPNICDAVLGTCVCADCADIAVDIAVDAGDDTTVDTTADTALDGSASDAADSSPDVSSPWVGPEETDAWRVTFTGNNRISPTDEKVLWMWEPGQAGIIDIEDATGLGNLASPLNCTIGCLIARDLTSMAVRTAVTGQGFATELGRLEPGLAYTPLAASSLEDVTDIHLVEGGIVHSEIASCMGASCQYLLTHTDLTSGLETPLVTYPSASEMALSTYQGHFVSGGDGSKVLMLNTTTTSSTVSLWAAGTGLVQLDFLCKFGTAGNCQGTGSEYSDQDPLALSPDGKYAVFFSFQNSNQEVRLYDLESPGTRYTTLLATVSEGAYLEKSCDFGSLKSWQWQRVVGTPRFTPDGKEVVFITETHCANPDGSIDKKPLRNIVRVKMETLLAGGVAVETDFFNVTKNPGGDVVANLVVTGMDVTPDGATIVFTASPKEGQLGPLSDTGFRQLNDRELFRVRLDGTQLEQVTDDLGWLAESPQVVPAASP